MEAPEHFIGEGHYGYKPPEQMQFTVDDLLNFSSEDNSAMIGDVFCSKNIAVAVESSGLTAVDSSNSSFSGGDSHFSKNFGNAIFSSAGLCVPNDEVAELEWLSNFVEDTNANTFLLQHQHTASDLMSGSLNSSTLGSEPNGRPGYSPRQPHAFPEAPPPSKSRSRRSRGTPCDWTTRLLHLSSARPFRSSPPPDAAHPDQVSRRCLHCAAEKTPQWRTGPMGPKTLCNACGVRYKSGRLVPEYRPAASPTFVSAQHSNSHRKVMELRRQKELQRVAQAHQQLLGHCSFMGMPSGRDRYSIDGSGCGNLI
ncbi:hypothetical protein SAY86_026826 [Trapa natans]|uniref:GATA transcription factor n=1 Tax=Trapa natans TaxID=22666 RepID=A0AAN7QEX5_TRANT|nr:hypothetical protein SAY86_026826 [Trapa natans]